MNKLPFWLHAGKGRRKKILYKRGPLNGGSVSIQSSMPPHQAHWVRAISGHRDCGMLTISLYVGYLHRRFRWILVSHRQKKRVSQPNGYVTAGAAAECEVIHELLAAMTSSAEPGEQNDIAKAWIRLQCLGPLVHQAQ